MRAGRALSIVVSKAPYRVQKITLLLADHPFPPDAERWLAGWRIHRRGFDFGGCSVSYSPKLFQRRMPSLKYHSDAGGGAAHLHGVRRSRRQPFG
jgi:hypothetical protein